MNAEELREMADQIEGMQQRIKTEAQARIAELPFSDAPGHEGKKVSGPMGALTRLIEKTLYFGLEPIKDSLRLYADMLDMASETSDEENDIIATLTLTMAREMGYDLDAVGITKAVGITQVVVKGDDDVTH